MCPPLPTRSTMAQCSSPCCKDRPFYGHVASRRNRGANGLRQAGTTRGGEPSTVSPGTLPRRMVAGHILLPYFSPGGKCEVSVTMDKDGILTKAETMGTANVNGFHAGLTVNLDLAIWPKGRTTSRPLMKAIERLLSSDCASKRALRRC